MARTLIIRCSSLPFHFTSPLSQTAMAPEGRRKPQKAWLPTLFRDCWTGFGSRHERKTVVSYKTKQKCMVWFRHGRGWRHLHTRRGLVRQDRFRWASAIHRWKDEYAGRRALQARAICVGTDIREPWNIPAGVARIAPLSGWKRHTERDCATLLCSSGLHIARLIAQRFRNRAKKETLLCHGLWEWGSRLWASQRLF